MNEEKQEKTMQEKVCKQVEEKIEYIINQGIKPENIDNLYKLVDIHKDLANEEYWEVKKEDIHMRYKNYGNYNEGSMGNYGRRMRDSRGRFMEGGYSARGYDSKYRGKEVLGDMMDAYEEYSESSEQFGRGNYSAKHDSMENLGTMLDSVVDFIAMLKKDANSQEELDLIKRYSKTISDM
jgi:hypothetical protein